jgi:YihY family inner membrane protein
VIAITSLGRRARRVWEIVRLAVGQFSRVDGLEWAAAFAHYSFLALFPVIVLSVIVASTLVSVDQAAKAVLGYLGDYVPIAGEMQRSLFATIGGVVEARGPASLIAIVMLVWASMKLFTTLITAVNRAWGLESPSWWRLPLRSLGFLGLLVVAVLVGITLPVLVRMVKDWLFPASTLHSAVPALVATVLPWGVVVVGLMFFYRFAPQRPTRLREVWVGAVCATVLLQGAAALFAIYLERFAALNAVYGALGSIVALLLWIHLSGSIVIFGACLGAAQLGAIDSVRPLVAAAGQDDQATAPATPVEAPAQPPSLEA